MIYALATLFYPDKQNVENMRELARQVDKLFLCDNTPDIDNETLFSDIGNNAVYIGNKQNLGLSQAFNIVLKNDAYCFNDDDYCIFFDQDSSIDNGHIQNLIDIYEKLENAKINIGILGPSFYDSTVGKVRIAKIKSKLLVEDCFSVPQVITSSMLIKYKTLQELNFWNEEIFLDFADWDLCFRAKNLGYEVVMTKKVLLHHSVGKGIKKIGFIKKHFDSPIREYYQTRDAMKMYKKKYVPLKFKLRFLYIFLFRPFFNCVLLPDGKKRKMFIDQARKDYKEAL